MPPSVCSQSSFPPPQPTATTSALAELAALTVRLFPPTAIATIRQTFVANPHLVIAEHLPILGNLVVRHVALCLCDEVEDVPVKQASEPTLERKQSQNGKSTPNRRIPPYRTLAYAAVRANRIIPASVPLSPAPASPHTRSCSSTISTRPPPRRLSITVPKRRPSQLQRSAQSQPELPFREKQSIPKDNAGKQVEEEKGEEKCEPIVALRERTPEERDVTPVGAVRRRRCTPSEGLQPKELFPRAGISTTIRSEACDSLHLREASNSQASRTSSTVGATQSGSRLVQMRRQRIERRAKAVR